uniref:Uncharacterized protein n=1 Tax=Amazona collaria TaxID=241587 RepID=A0A8B9GFK9_9PSIT
KPAISVIFLIAGKDLGQCDLPAKCIAGWAEKEYPKLGDYRDAGEGLFIRDCGERTRGQLMFSVICSSLGQEPLQSQSGWVLPLALLHKYTASNSHLDQPVFWPEEEQRWLLQGTGIPEAVEKDLASIHLEYSSMILLFIESYPNIFDPKLYKQLVAFVMAYRNLLEEEDEDKGPSPPMMVANHSANLEYSSVNAKLLQQAASCSGSSLP